MDWWKILGIVVFLLILFIVGYYFFQESPEKYYRRSRRLHKKGESAYGQGNFETAEEYYAKADEHRKRARELE